MTIKIHKFLKTDLSEDSSITSTLTETEGMTISHFAGSTKSTEATIPYIIEGFEKHVPYIENVEFCVVTRKKIDLTATGINENIKKNIGEDIGEYDHIKSVPVPPSDLPPGFTELYKKQENQYFKSYYGFRYI